MSRPPEPARLERFTRSVARLRARRTLDAHRIQLAVGGLLVGLGLVAILLGWYGASHTGYGFEQTPYLISGGLLGVALVFLGGFVYFAAWVARLVRESQRGTERTLEHLERLTVPNGAQPRIFVATRGGKLFHRPDCPIVAGRSGLRRLERPDGLEPCAMCDPLAT